MVYSENKSNLPSWLPLSTTTSTSTATTSTYNSNNKYFTNLTLQKAILYGLAVFLVAAAGMAAIVELLVETPCEDVDANVDMIEFKNPSHRLDPCRDVRYAHLFWLTKQECKFSRSQLAAVFLGGIIGWERRQADRPAGIRTMALVSLGACLFTINSAFAFLQSPMSWDSSRVSAAIPSGVGFLGSALIFKEAQKSDAADDGESSQHVVHGLTTAASVWLSAAVGIACGGELYFSALYCTSAVLVLLRFGPRMPPQDLPSSDMSVQLPGSVYHQPNYRSVKFTSPTLSSSESSRRGAGEVEEQQEQREEGDEAGETNRLITSRRNQFLTERPRQRPHFSSLV